MSLHAFAETLAEPPARPAPSLSDRIRATREKDASFTIDRISSILSSPEFLRFAYALELTKAPLPDSANPVDFPPALRDYAAKLRAIGVDLNQLKILLDLYEALPLRKGSGIGIG